LEQVTQGFPKSTRRNIDTFHLAFTPDGYAFAIVENKLYHSGDGGVTWEMIWESPEDLLMISSHK
jgi:hypothetical protein